MHFKQADEEDEGNAEKEEEEEEEMKKHNPGAVISRKVLVTRESGLQASESTR